MEIPRTYEPTSGNKPDYINIDNILLDGTMVKHLLFLNKDINLDQYKINNEKSLGRLERGHDMEIAFKNKIPLDPVDLVLIKEGRPARTSIPYTRPGAPPRPPQNYPAEPPLYGIINGRHRVVYSIINGMTHVPARILAGT